MSLVRDAISSGNETSLLLAASKTSKHCSWQMNGGIVDSWLRLKHQVHSQYYRFHDNSSAILHSSKEIHRIKLGYIDEGK